MICYDRGGQSPQKGPAKSTRSTSKLTQWQTPSKQFTLIL